MQLETKHVLPYALYDLKMITDHGSIWTLRPSSFPNNWHKNFGSKPILRPLAEFYLNRDGFGGYESFQDFKIAVDNKLFPYYVFETLFENHFDVFGLISQGLAIDTNTIKQ